jgi:hypothetical protein
VRTVPRGRAPLHMWCWRLVQRRARRVSADWYQWQLALLCAHWLPGRLCDASGACGDNGSVCIAGRCATPPTTTSAATTTLNVCKRTRAEGCPCAAASISADCFFGLVCNASLLCDKEKIVPRSTPMPCPVAAKLNDERCDRVTGVIKCARDAYEAAGGPRAQQLSLLGERALGVGVGRLRSVRCAS